MVVRGVEIFRSGFDFPKEGADVGVIGFVLSENIRFSS